MSEEKESKIISYKEICSKLKEDGDTIEKFKEEIEGYKLYEIKDNYTIKRLTKAIRKQCKDEEEYRDRCRITFFYCHQDCYGIPQNIYIITKIRAKFPIVLSEFSIDNPDYIADYYSPTKSIVLDKKTCYKYRTSCIVIDNFCDCSGNIIEIDDSLKKEIKLSSPFYYYAYKNHKYARFNQFIIADELDLDADKDCSNGIHFFYDINVLKGYFEKLQFYY